MLYRVKKLYEYENGKNNLYYSNDYDHLEQAVAFLVEEAKYDLDRYNNLFNKATNAPRTFTVIQCRKDYGDLWENLDEKNCGWFI